MPSYENFQRYAWSEDDAEISDKDNVTEPACYSEDSDDNMEAEDSVNNTTEEINILTKKVHKLLRSIPTSCELICKYMSRQMSL
jgi:hypothetical protein